MKKEGMKHVWVVVNPMAGNKKYNQKEPFISEYFKKYQLSPTFFQLEELSKALKNAKELDSLHAIVVIGGDGTVRSVANELVGRNLPLGIIPGGTFNHLAKDIKMPDDLDTCLQIIADRHVIFIDIAEVNGYNFLNNSSIGIYPLAVKYRHRYFHNIKWLGMFLALIKMFIRFPMLKVNYIFENKNFEVITPLVFISNNLYYLDLLRLTERKRLDGGELFLYINHCRTRLKFLALLLNVLFRKRKKVAGLFEIHAVKECVLKLAKNKMDVSMDGEVFKLTNPLYYRIHKKQLALISPENP